MPAVYWGLVVVFLLATVNCFAGPSDFAGPPPDSAGAGPGWLWFDPTNGEAGDLSRPADSNPPPVRIERVYFDDHAGKAHSLEPAPDAQLFLPAGSHNVEIQFTVLSSTARRPAKFTTRLTRNAREISATASDRSVVAFDWLPPGDYQFHVTTDNDDRARDMDRVTLHFTVLPFYWQTNWFRLCVALGLVLGTALVAGRTLQNRHRRTVEKLEERKRAQAVLVAEHESRLRAERESHHLSQRLLTAHEDERRWLARELHDDMTQRLARLAIDAAQAERGVPAAPDHRPWRRMREELVRLSEDVHSLAYRLHPSILDDLGLVAALQTECERFSRRESVPVQFKARDVPLKIPRAAALCLFRIGQESLRNVARHARAQAVEVSLARTDGGLHLTVHDNGIGFNSAQTHEHASLGLASMKERVHLLAGELDIESEPGHGTTIVAWVPLKEAMTS